MTSFTARPLLKKNVRDKVRALHNAKKAILSLCVILNLFQDLTEGSVCLDPELNSG